MAAVHSLGSGNGAKKKPKMTLAEREAADAAHEKFTDCIIAAEKKCMGRVLCSGCGTKLKVFAGPGKKLSSAPAYATGKLTPAEMSRSRIMCSDESPLHQREKKELLRIARALGLQGVSERLTKKELCGRIRAAITAKK